MVFELNVFDVFAVEAMKYEDYIINKETNPERLNLKKTPPNIGKNHII